MRSQWGLKVRPAGLRAGHLAEPTGWALPQWKVGDLCATACAMGRDEGRVASRTRKGLLCVVLV